MKARDNPTMKQALRRLRGRPQSDNDPRWQNDPYWVERQKGHPHSYAKRVHREAPPKIIENVAVEVPELDPEDILISPGTILRHIEVEIRPYLNEEVAESAGARNIEYTIWDGRVAGLGLRVRTTGYKSYILLYRIRGWKKLHKFTLGSAGTLTLDVARDMARDLKAEALMGRDPMRLFRKTKQTKQ